MGITKKYATYETYETKMLHVSQRRALEFETLILSYVNEQKKFYYPHHADMCPEHRRGRPTYHETF